MTSPTAGFEHGASASGAPALAVFGGQASDVDIELMGRVFSAAADRPDLIPQTFLSYLVDYLQTSDIQIAISQVTGLSQLQVQPAAPVVASESTGSAMYTDLNTGGPQVSGLADGNYLVIVQAVIIGASGAFMSVAVNGSIPSDNDGAECSSSSAVTVTGMSTQKLDNGNNTLVAKYRVAGGTGTFALRKLFVLKYANL